MKRRRSFMSDWVLALQQSRNARRLRSQPQNLQTTTGPSAPRDDPHHDQEFPNDSPGQHRHEERTRNDSQRGNQHSLMHEADLNVSPALGEDRAESDPKIIDMELTPFQPFDEKYPYQDPFPDLEDDIGVPMYAQAPSIGAEAPDTNLVVTAGGVEEPDTSQAMSRLRHSGSLQLKCAGSSHLITAQDSNACTRSANLNLLTGSRLKWEQKLTLAAMISVVGSVKYSVEQYDYLKDILDEEVPDNEDPWPSYSRIHRYVQDVVDSYMLKSVLVDLPKKNTNLSEGSHAAQDETETGRVRIFLPSAWSKLDVATSVVFYTMYKSSENTNVSDNGIEESMIVQQRELITNSCEYLSLPWSSGDVPCGSGSIIEVLIKRRRSSINTGYRMSHHGDLSLFAAPVVATWCPGAKDASNGSLKRALHKHSLSHHQKAIIKTLSTANSRTKSDLDEEFTVLPGDMCTLLTSEGTSQRSTCDAVMVNRFWRLETGTTSVMILWMRPKIWTRRDSTKIAGVEVQQSDIVLHVRLRRPELPSYMEDTRRFHPHGILADGSKYIVYRIILYCGDFQQSSSSYNKGSAGCCYFLPVSLPPEARRSSSAVRVISLSLTPPGVSTNDVLHYIVDDLVDSAVHGVEGRTPSGEKVRIFIDVVGFVGDYPAALSTLDVVGHTGRAPSTVCSFRRLHASESVWSRHGYTTEVHASNPTFLRHAERHLSLRSSEISDADANLLGKIKSIRYELRSSPLIHFSKKLKTKESLISKSSHGYPVISGKFDPYRCNLIAPDHLLTGLSQDCLNTAFKSLPNDTMRSNADIYICGALRQNGLLSQNEVFNLTKKSLHNMTLSGIFAVLLVASPTLLTLTALYPPEHVSRQAVSLLAQVSNLIALTYWWPRKDIDGEDAVRYVCDKESTYISALKEKSKAYVRAVDDFCKQFPERKQHLDKPNLHRLIELYEHSMPMFGHVREYMELVLESADQPMKICIRNSNNRNSHIFATEHSIGNDWQSRIATLIRELKQSDSRESVPIRRSLRRLLLGEEADYLSEDVDSEFITETDDIIQRLFTKVVCKRFEREGRISNFVATKITAWVARCRSTTSDLSRCIGFDERTTDQMVSNAIAWLEAMYPSIDFSEEESSSSK